MVDCILRIRAVDHFFLSKCHILRQHTNSMHRANIQQDGSINSTSTVSARFSSPVGSSLLDVLACKICSILCLLLLFGSGSSMEAEAARRQVAWGWISWCRSFDVFPFFGATSGYSTRHFSFQMAHTYICKYGLFFLFCSFCYHV